MMETAITRAGLERLRKELEQLTTAGRDEIAERIRSASRAESNAVESADFQDAREDQALLERRIAILKERIASARVVEPNGRNGVVDLGERVRLRDLETDEQIEYEVVGSLEADPFARRISAASPLGRALLGRRRGDVAVVDAPRGRVRFQILSISAAPTRVRTSRSS
jgi:transcription elongation factor GreA